jgi:hypothetical protein
MVPLLGGRSASRVSAAHSVCEWTAIVCTKIRKDCRRSASSDSSLMDKPCSWLVCLHCLVSWSVGHVVVQQRIVRAALAVCVNVQPVRLPLFGTKRVSLLEGEAWLLRAV